MRISRGIAFVALLCAVALLGDSGQTVAFPAAYRTWAVTRSFISNEGRNAGFHHYYANPQALEGFTTGKFPDGAVIVMSVWKWINMKGVASRVSASASPS
jgi:hypothetical protein